MNGEIIKTGFRQTEKSHLSLSHKPKVIFGNATLKMTLKYSEALYPIPNIFSMTAEAHKNTSIQTWMGKINMLAICHLSTVEGIEGITAPN